ncbi:MAG TPA: cytochrome c3 family protein, partial [bacterium]|nr:cytochrome c3 family protein [bacterium]
MNWKLCFSLILVGFALTTAFGQEGQDQNTCVTCHEMMGAPYESIVTAQQPDVHGENGITCVDCHGGDPTSMDPEQSMSEAAGYIGTPDPTEIPQVCADCHSDAEYMGEFDPGLPVDQLAKYQTSQHGQLLLEAGDTKVAECVSCHGAHGIMPVDDPRAEVYPLNVPNTCNECHGDVEYMAEYNIPTDQFQEYKNSVHGMAVLDNQDLGAPACNDCHGNHGATPPGVTSISQVCGTCHANNMRLFQGSVHEPVFDMMGLPECETCHG